MIKELDIKEIKIIEDYIYLMKDNFPYYFLGEKKKYSDRGFLLANNSYYLNVQVINNYNFIGLCKLGDNNYLLELVILFKNLLKELKRLNIWVFEENVSIIKLIEKSRIYLKNRSYVSSKIEDNGIFIYTFKEV